MNAVKNRLRDFALIEPRRTFTHDAFQQVRLLRRMNAIADLYLTLSKQPLPRPRESLRPGGVLAHPRTDLHRAADIMLIRDEPRLREFDRRSEHLRTRHRAPPFQRVHHPRHVPRHAHRPPAPRARVGIVDPLEKICLEVRRGRLAIVQNVRPAQPRVLATRTPVQHQKPAPAHPARIRPHHRQRETRRHRRVHRVAPALQDRNPRRRRQRMIRRDRGVRKSSLLAPMRHHKKERTSRFCLPPVLSLAACGLPGASGRDASRIVSISLASFLRPFPRQPTTAAPHIHGRIRARRAPRNSQWHEKPTRCSESWSPPSPLAWAWRLQSQSSAPPDRRQRRPPNPTGRPPRQRQLPRRLPPAALKRLRRPLSQQRKQQRQTKLPPPLRRLMPRPRRPLPPHPTLPRASTGPPSAPRPGPHRASNRQRRWARSTRPRPTPSSSPSRR